mgnify:CR=1 FL=1|tara:strand:- start:200 stop:628 length:429 start_codon:yes stop_codon:yes gene_type:complete
MSYLNTRQALITQFLATTVTGLTVADIATDNEFFDPANRSLWAMLTVIPATSDAMGKGSTDTNEDRGILQVSVFVPVNIKDRSILSATAVDEIRAGFQFNTATVYNGQQVSIQNITVNQGRVTEAWFQTDISINYLTFSNRG